MRVTGNGNPDIVSVEKYDPIPGKADVRVRENIHEIEVANPDGKTTSKMYEYDEYRFIVTYDRPLKREIENNLDSWLEAGRNSEIKTNATLYLNAKQNAVDEYTNELIEQGIL